MTETEDLPTTLTEEEAKQALKDGKPSLAVEYYSFKLQNLYEYQIGCANVAVFNNTGNSHLNVLTRIWFMERLY
jgi:hypothetical protein